MENNEEIKAECESLYSQIKNAQERLKEIRSMCQHEHTYLTNYEWRVGAVIPANICIACGHVVVTICEII